MNRKRKLLLEKLKCEVNWLFDEKFLELFLDELEKNFDIKSGMTIPEYIDQRKAIFDILQKNNLEDNKFIFEYSRAILINKLNKKLKAHFSLVDKYYQDEISKLRSDLHYARWDKDILEANLDGIGLIHGEPVYNPYAIERTSRKESAGKISDTKIEKSLFTGYEKIKDPLIKKMREGKSFAPALREVFAEDATIGANLESLLQTIPKWSGKKNKYFSSKTKVKETDVEMFNFAFEFNELYNKNLGKRSTSNR
jgi:hypothetical protein